LPRRTSGKRIGDEPEVLFDLSTEESEYRNRATEAAYEDDVTGFRQRRRELGYGDETVPVDPPPK